MPVRQFGSSESVSSVDWLKDNSPTLIAGMSMKWIRVYDIRSK